MLAGLVLFAFGIKPFITMSGSMEPEIHTGSVCFVDTKAEYDEILTGDVIAYRAGNGGLVTHRVLSISDEGMETKGDANEVTDGISTTPVNFYGKTLFSIPYVGYVIKTLQQPVYIAVIAIAVIGMFVYSAVDSYYAKKENKEGNSEENGDGVEAAGKEVKNESQA